MPGSPIQALLWKNWKLTWLPLLVQQVCVITFGWLSLMFFSDEDTYIAELSMGAHIVVLLGLIFLLVVSATIPKKDGSRSYVTGFPFRQEFALPISSNALFAVPILYFAAVFLFAYAFPLMILNIMLGTAGPQPVIALLVLEVILITISLSWWTSSLPAHTLGWCTVLILAYPAWLYPEVILSEVTLSEGILSDEPLSARAASLSEYVLPVTITAALLLITLLGVRKQRHGENLFGFGSNKGRPISEYAFRKIQFGSLRPCPTDSAVKAEFWKEGQLHSKFLAASLGVTSSLAGLIILRLLEINEMLGNGDTVVLDDVGPLSFGFYGMVFMTLHINSFGITTRSGVSSVSTFQRTTGLGSAQLFLIQFLHKYVNLLIGGAALIVSTWLIGPLFITNFADIQVSAQTAITDYLSLPETTFVYDAGRFLVFLATASIAFSLFIAWFMLKPKAMSWGLMGVFVYVFLLTVSVARYTEPSDLIATNRVIQMKHLWLFIAGLPLITIYLYRSVMRDMTLTMRQLFTVVAACALIWVFRTYLLVDGGLFTRELETELIVSNILVGLLPLLAIGGALFTMNKIRHG